MKRFLPAIRFADILPMFADAKNDAGGPDTTMPFQQSELDNNPNLEQNLKY